MLHSKVSSPQYNHETININITHGFEKIIRVVYMYPSNHNFDKTCRENSFRLSHDIISLFLPVSKTLPLDLVS